jgi:hypothetical protein
MWSRASTLKKTRLVEYTLTFDISMGPIIRTGSRLQPNGFPKGASRRVLVPRVLVRFRWDPERALAIHLRGVPWIDSVAWMGP